MASPLAARMAEMKRKGKMRRRKGGGGLSSEKAKTILRDKTVRGHPITAKQKRFFGFIAGGGTPTKV